VIYRNTFGGINIILMAYISYVPKLMASLKAILIRGYREGDEH